MTNIPNTAPVGFTAGDTVVWTHYDGNYLPADGYVLSIAIVITGVKVTADATDNGDGSHLFTIPGTATAELTASPANWQIYATKSGARQTLSFGQFVVTPDFADAATGLDARSEAEKIIAAIDAMMANKATADQQSYSVSGRALSRYPVTELLEMRRYYVRIVSNEKAQAAKTNGLPGGGVIKTRFN